MQGLGCFEADRHGRLCYRPPVPPFPKLDEVWAQFRRADRAVAEFDQALASFAVPEVVGKLFARWDAVESSGAEGTTTTFGDLLAFHSAPQRVRDAEDARQVAGVADAFDDLANDATPSFTEAALAIHRRLFARAGAGKLKTYPNGTYDPDAPSGIFHFTAPDSTRAALAEWEAFTAASDDRPELVRQALSHWMFEHIHPLPDGNGRIGRLLVPLAMRRKGASRQACAFLGEAVRREKAIHVEALKDTRRSGDPGPWTRLFCAMIAEGAIANLDRLGRLGRVHARWRSALRGVRAHSVAHRLIPWVLTTPTFTLRDAMKAFGVSFQAIGTAVARLEAEGIVGRVDDAARNRVFSAPEVIGLFAPPPPWSEDQREKPDHHQQADQKDHSDGSA
ncbi:MAG: Fic family protein [Alphaproteobacteria bacterium]|nr:Fic family protein [Alphaproteobacteria bacterium]